MSTQAPCECGARKCGTTHSHWCPAAAAPVTAVSVTGFAPVGGYVGYNLSCSVDVEQADSPAGPFDSVLANRPITKRYIRLLRGD